MAAGIAVATWEFWGGDATDPVPAAVLDVTVVSQPETLEPREVQTTVREPAEPVERAVLVEADAGAPLQTPRTRMRERSHGERANVTREGAGQEPLRRQNPYRKGSTE